MGSEVKRPTITEASWVRLPAKIVRYIEALERRVSELEEAARDKTGEPTRVIVDPYADMRGFQPTYLNASDNVRFVVNAEGEHEAYIDVRLIGVDSIGRMSKMAPGEGERGAIQLMTSRTLVLRPEVSNVVNVQVEKR